MSFKEGHKKIGGRKKGTPNKTTKELKEHVISLLNSHEADVSSWFDKVAETKPEKALELYIKLLQFVLPKTREQELHKDQEPLSAVIRFTK